MFCSAALAQIDQGTIGGSVKDPSGAAIPNAAITIENAGTRFRAVTQTDAEGVCAFSPVKVSQYSATIAAQGS